jgi:hypothetical protein
VYETIEEEMSSAVNSPIPSPPSVALKKSKPSIHFEPVFIVDPETASANVNSDSHSVWDDETGIIALRRYYALRDEAQDAVVESKRLWEDTPFSTFAVQCTYLFLAYQRVVTDKHTLQLSNHRHIPLA